MTQQAAMFQSVKIMLGSLAAQETEELEILKSEEQVTAEAEYIRNETGLMSDDWFDFFCEEIEAGRDASEIISSCDRNN